jgi:hypothetical protein
MRGRSTLVAFALVALPGLLSPAAAQVYEDWSGPMRADRWQIYGLPNNGAPLEQKRLVTARKLDLEFRNSARQGEPARDAFIGYRLLPGNLPLDDPASVTELDVTFTQTREKFTKQCTEPGSPEVVSLIRLQKFNDGSTSGPGDQTGDYFATVTTRHSLDEPGIVVRSSIGRCTNATCTSFDNAATNEPSGGYQLGTVTRGKPYRLRLIWRAANDMFISLLGNGGFEMTYDPSIDGTPAERPTAAFGIGGTPGNRLDGFRMAEIAVKVGAVRTNGSSLVP